MLTSMPEYFWSTLSNPRILNNYSINRNSLLSSPLTPKAFEFKKCRLVKCLGNKARSDNWIWISLNKQVKATV
jgi:hypothetical protein